MEDVLCIVILFLCRSKLDGGGGHDEVGRRSAKLHHGTIDRERKERERHGGGGGGGVWPEKQQAPPTSSTAPVDGVGGGGEAGGKEGGGGGGRGGGRGEDRRKRDEEWLEQRDLTRKRKRESAEVTRTPPPVEESSVKRIKTSEYSSSGSKEEPRTPSDTSILPAREDKYSRKETDPSSDRRRRYEHASLEHGKDPSSLVPSSKKPRSSGEREASGSGSGGRKHSLSTSGAPPSSSAGSGARKKSEHHHKGRGEQQEHGGGVGGGGVSESEKAPPPKLDWTSISALSLPCPRPSSTSAVQRFSPGAVFSRLGVSRTLAGPALHARVSSAVSNHLSTRQEGLSLECGNRLPDSLLEHPFGEESDFAMTGVSWIKTVKENCRVCVNIGPNRRALVASADFALRRKLGKVSKVSANVFLHVVYIVALVDIRLAVCVCVCVVCVCVCVCACVCVCVCVCVCMLDLYSSEKHSMLGVCVIHTQHMC